MHTVCHCTCDLAEVLHVLTMCYIILYTPATNSFTWLSCVPLGLLRISPYSSCILLYFLAQGVKEKVQKKEKANG